MSDAKNIHETEINESDAAAVAGGLSVGGLAVRGDNSAQTENGDQSQKLYKITHDGGTSEDWGPALTSR
jgi:hypothetical protein